MRAGLRFGRCAALFCAATAAACGGGDVTFPSGDLQAQLPPPFVDPHPPKDDTPPPGTPPDPANPDPVEPPDPPAPLTWPQPCHPLYDENLLPTFEVEISSANWSALQTQFRENPDLESEFPVTFRYGGEVVTDATIRLRGNHSRCNEKMQFAIAFNRVDEKKRFQGLRRLNLDHGGCKVMEERLALSYLRDLGLPAACANHARLIVNGKYYGLFTNIEHVNKDFLRRNFGPAANDGNLWKSGNKLRTNEETGDTSDIEAFWDARTVPEIDALTDLEEAVVEWAAEGILPARDNFFLFGWNYYVYNHPTRGFVFIPTDMDRTFSQSLSGADDDLFAEPPAKPADVVLADPLWRAKYQAAIRRGVEKFDVPKLQGRLDRWWAQVSPSAAADPHATLGVDKVLNLQAYLEARRAWLDGWVQRNPAP